MCACVCIFVTLVSCLFRFKLGSYLFIFIELHIILLQNDLNCVWVGVLIFFALVFILQGLEKLVCPVSCPILTLFFNLKF